jgi:hypothetical protein
MVPFRAQRLLVVQGVDLRLRHDPKAGCSRSARFLTGCGETTRLCRDIAKSKTSFCISGGNWRIRLSICSGSDILFSEFKKVMLCQDDLFYIFDDVADAEASVFFKLVLRL